MIFFLFSFYLMALYSAVWADFVLCFLIIIIVLSILTIKRDIVLIFGDFD